LVIAAAVSAQGCTKADSSGGAPLNAGAGGVVSGAGGANGGSAGTAGMGLPTGGMGGAGTGGIGGAGGQAGASGETGGTAAGAGGSIAGSGGMMAGEGGADSGVPIDGGDGTVDPLTFAAGLHELFLHDACTGAYAPQPDTCLHEQEVEQATTFGGEAGTVYDVTLRVRGVVEPTTISGGESPLAEHPYFKVGGSVAAVDYSHWHIEVSDPPQTYWLNHYPSTSHTIYAEDFEAVIAVEAGAEVVVRVIDGNDRQIDNAEMGPPDRRKLIEGVTPEVLDGQMLRLDVIGVAAR